MIIEKFIFLRYNELNKLEFEEACDDNNQGGYDRGDEHYADRGAGEIIIDHLSF